MVETHVIDVSRTTVQALKILAVIALILLCTSIVKAVSSGKKKEASESGIKYWQDLVSDKNIKHKPGPKVDPVVVVKDKSKKNRDNNGSVDNKKSKGKSKKKGKNK